MKEAINEFTCNDCKKELNYEKDFLYEVYMQLGTVQCGNVVNFKKEVCEQCYKEYEKAFFKLS